MKLVIFTNLGEPTSEETTERNNLVKLDNGFEGRRWFEGKSCGLGYSVISL